MSIKLVSKENLTIFSDNLTPVNLMPIYRALSGTHFDRVLHSISALSLIPSYAASRLSVPTQIGSSLSYQRPLI